MKTVHVDVTQECIDRGKRKSHCLCPIAIAIKPHFPRLIGVAEEYVQLRATSPDKGRDIAYLPAVAVNFIAAFDRGDPVDPFAFNLEVPDDA